jgi:uncharacterized repeat protein (TIGR04076 family)
MADSYDVQIMVISQKGLCGAGHKVGDKWIIGSTTPAGICSITYNVLYPNIRTFKFGGVLPWEKNPDVCTMACPDPDNPVVFELKRLKK